MRLLHSAVRVPALLLALAAAWPVDLISAWPDPASFPLGSPATLRLPPFSGVPGYPDGELLFYQLHLPPNYDRTRAYPLCVRFQPQGGKPNVSEITGYFGPQVVVLAVSRSKGAAADGMLTLHDRAVFLSTIHWLMDHWNIDRHRVYFGGFSMGGWDASAVGMRHEFTRLSTHFLILGAGVRGDYQLPAQAGKSALVANGTEDMNFSWGQKAVDILSGGKLEVTKLFEPGIGHAVGPQMRKLAGEWFAAADPAAHAAEWLAFGEAKLASKSERGLAISRLLAVASLGSSTPEAAKAIALLDRGADLGEAQKLIEACQSALAAGDFHATRHHAGLLQKAAAKSKAIRLQLLAERFARDSWEWQVIAHQVEMKAAWDAGCSQEAALLALAGSGIYLKMFSDWEFIADPYAFYLKVMEEAKRPAPGKDEAKAQKVLAELRVRLWNDQLNSAAVLQKAVKQLATVLEPLPPAAAVRVRGEQLAAQLELHGQLLGYPAAAAPAKPAAP